MASAVERRPADAKAAKTAATSITAFGIDFYRRMLADPSLDLKGKNVVFSPTSIALALGMVRAGAKGRTAAQIDEVLHAADWDTFGPALGSLGEVIASRDGTYDDDEGHLHALALRIANSSFAQRGWAIEPGYLDAIARDFGASQRLVDYMADPEAARKTINAWVSRQTEQRIPELLTPDNVSALTRFYLVNAVYLKANWVVPFIDGETTPRAFHAPSGVIDVPTMTLRGDQEVPYVAGDGWKATELRYRGKDGTLPLAMTLIMPDDMAAFERGLSGAQVGKIAASLQKERARLVSDITQSGQEDDCGSYPYSLNLFMPRFDIGTRAQLKEVLAGARDARRLRSGPRRLLRDPSRQRGRRPDPHRERHPPGEHLGRREGDRGGGGHRDRHGYDRRLHRRHSRPRSSSSGSTTRSSSRCATWTPARSCSPAASSTRRRSADGGALGQPLPVDPARAVPPAVPGHAVAAGRPDVDAVGAPRGGRRGAR